MLPSGGSVGAGPLGADPHPGWILVEDEHAGAHLEEEDADADGTDQGAPQTHHRPDHRSKPYWDAADAVQQENWETVVRPYLHDKLAAIEDVLNGINVKRYQHYEGSMHFTWLKLELAPYEIRVRLDADAEDNDFIPDVLAWVDKVRDLLNSPRFKAFEAEGEAGDDNRVTVFVPSRQEAEARRVLRNAEAGAFAAWQAQEAAAATEGGNDKTAVVEAAEAENEAPAAEATPVEKPVLAGALEYRTLEFIKHSGVSKFFDVASDSWKD